MLIEDNKIYNLLETHLLTRTLCHPTQTKVGTLQKFQLHFMQLITVFIPIEAWAFLSYKRLLTMCLYEPFSHFVFTLEC